MFRSRYEENNNSKNNKIENFSLKCYFFSKNFFFLN